MLTNRQNKNNADRKLRKLELEKKSLINCGHCPYNKGENANHHRPRPDKHKTKKRDTIRKFSEERIAP